MSDASDTGSLHVYECANCGSDVRVVGQLVGEPPEWHTERLKFACGCMTMKFSSDAPDGVPPNWVQNYDYEVPINVTR